MTASVMQRTAAGNATTNHSVRRNMCRPRVGAAAGAPPPGCGTLRVVGVQALAQVLARLKEGNEFLGHRHGRPGAGVATDARGAVFDGEGAKAPQLDPIAARQRLDDLV